MNFTELVTAVYNRLGVPSTDALLTSTIVGANVNEALQEINSEEDWPWLNATETLTTVAGTQAYALNALWLRTRSVTVLDDYPLERYTEKELTDFWPFSSSTARPQGFAIEGGQILFGPIPNAVYSVRHRYVKMEATIASTTVPLMPAQFHSSIVELAMHITLKRSREDARSQEALASYQRWLSKMRKERRRHTGPGRIRTTQW